jgi:MraZ protein
LDKLGRILVPQLLRNHAAIQKNVVIVGMNKKIEIWSEEAWADVAKKAVTELEVQPKLVSRFGL